MRAPISLVCITALSVGCSFPTSDGAEPEVVDFTLNGTAQSTTFVSGGIVGSAFYLTAANYAGFGELGFGVSRFTGPDTYPIIPFDSTASASLRPRQGQLSYDTRLFGGRGQIVVTANNCRTSTGKDPITGIYGTFTFCTVVGTFEFSAKSQAADSVVIANGHFRWTVQQR